MNKEILLELPMRWMDMDAYQHLNSGRYLDYTVEARLQWMAQHEVLQKWIDEHRLQFVMVKQSFEYFKPVVYPCTILLHQTVLRVGKSSIEFGYVFSLKEDSNTVYTKAWAKLVCFDPKAKKAFPYPADIRELLVGETCQK